ncbi:MAG: molecular chaperone DnaK (HSP70), partial [Lentisphaeria bacterium]
MTEATASNNRKTAAHYLVGIDLGTTHTVVAFADVNEPLSADSRGIFHIEQLVAPGEVAKRPMLPSFRYHPVAGEISAHDMLLPWSSEEGETGKGSTNTESASTDATHLAGEIPEVVIGEWARELGSKVEGRLVSSAKSWLSHPHTDRQADILPWAAAEGVHKVSPVFASASYLHYLRCAWNHQHPHARLEHQEIVITIPASFDEGARALTVAAAKQAGLDNILLIEEPQAVCYDWYARHQRDAETSLKDIRLLLVCDVGGGTTDLSLIKITSNKNGLTLDRIGVGDHLMLGGDNIDLALAHIVEQRLAGNKKLSAAQLSQLSQQTCQAKERLLSADGPCQAKVTLLGSGSRLIGNAKSCLLQREEVYQLAIDGFFPLSDFAALPDKKRSAVVAFGLPYARDPAISKHLAAFITQHREACTQALQPDSQTSVNGAPAKAIPDALLLNGGVFNSAAVRQRTLDLFRHWGSQNTKLLDNHHPEHAVAYGAVAYLMARRGSGLKIGGGSARSFFLMLENSENTPAEQSNNESSPTVKSGLCLLPKGSEPGAEVALTEHTFLLTVGQPVKFKVASCTGDNPYGAGDRADIDTAFVQLPPLITALRDDTEQPPINIANATENTQIKVSLHAVLTEVGTLQIDCIEVENKTAEARRWQLEFEVRHKRLQTNKAALKATPDSSNAPAIPTSLPVNFAAAAEKIEA